MIETWFVQKESTHNSFYQFSGKMQQQVMMIPDDDLFAEILFIHIDNIIHKMAK